MAMNASTWFDACGFDGRFSPARPRSDAELIAEAKMGFPDTFGLRCWHKRLFRISRRTYVTVDRIVILYLDIQLQNGEWGEGYFKGTVAELQREIVRNR